MSKCIGCGVVLQNDDKLRLGYVPLASMIEKGEKVYCERCFNLRHYNKVFDYDEKISEQPLISVIKGFVKKNVLIILIIDILDLYGGFIPNLSTFLGENKVILVLNKIDLLPKGIKVAPIINQVKEIAKNEKLNVINVLPLSAIKFKKEDVLKPIFKVLNQKKSLIEDVYVIGATSVGKSTFINGLLETNLITTSERHQTTLGTIKIPIGYDLYRRFHHLIDTPGFVNKRNIGYNLSYESTRYLMPKSFLKVRTYQLNGGQTIFLGGLVRIDFITGEHLSASFFVANELYIHRGKTIQADAFFEKQTGKLLIPPFVEEMEWLKETKKEEFFLSDGKDNDLFISGLGFVHFSGNDLKIVVTSPIETLVKLAPSLIAR